MDPKVWQDMLVLTLPVLEKILRPIIVYVFLVVGCDSRASGSWPSSTRSTWSCC